MADIQQAGRQLSKSEKAAIIFLYMDEQLTSDVFGQMQDEEIKKVANAMLHMNKIPADQVQAVLEEFLNGYNNKSDKKVNSDVAIDGNEIVESMLSKNLSRNRSQSIMQALKGGDKKEALTTSEVDFKKMIETQEAENLFEALKEEHPQIVAITLSNCKKKTARDLLEMFPEDAQPELLVRMASLTKVPGQMMTDLKNFLSKKLNDLKKEAASPTAVKKKIDFEIEGMSDTVRLLKSLKKDKSMKMVEDIEKIDAEIGGLISKQMFTIEDLGRANDVGIRELLRAISNEDLKVSLKNAPDAVKDKFFGNMSQRAAMILREDIEVLPALKVEEIEVAEENILKAAKELMKQEKLLLTEAESSEDE
ncbi:MAG: hypothetical protein ACD_73C00593G0002 [uncultured bacterium]|nr:MAG: hypothetical protein ACD_73C00593G0002 [uncultured bacterium]